tara:strand:+ start:859 stop:2073 length:1215 start_codon:yes stop_codon:yes gene_type:complete
MKNVFCFLLFIAFFAGFSTQTSLAQVEFRDGFIIKANNDTIRGQVLQRSLKNRYESCTFKSSEGVTVYLPTEIRGYGYSNGGSFITGVADNAFVQVLVDGHLSLYEYGTVFYVRKEGAVAQILESKRVEVVREGRLIIQKDEAWKARLAVIMNDCEAMLMRNYELKRKSLTETVVAYNECAGKTFTKEENVKLWVNVNLGLGVGYTNTSMGLKNLDAQYRYLDTDYKESDPTLFFDLGFSLPGLAEKLSIHTGFSYSKPSFSSTEMVNGSLVDAYYDNYVNYDFLSIPLLLQYAIPFDHTTLAFDAGVSFDNYMNSSAVLQTARVFKNASNRIELSNNEFAVFDEKQASYLAGVRVRRKVGYFSAEVGIRYTIQSGQLVPPVFLESANFESSVKRLSLSLNLIW